VLKIIKENSGVYLLEIFATVPFQIELEKFKEKVFPQGYYYYAGSGQKNLQQRVDRHLDETKNTHWHIDYITNIATNKPKSIFIFDNADKKLECKLIRDLIDNFRLRIIVRGFGNSDCNRCETHLLYCKQRLTHSHFTAQYQSIVRVMPASSETS
jgi:sugar fermentation stimulation protein A